MSNYAVEEIGCRAQAENCNCGYNLILPLWRNKLTGGSNKVSGRRGQQGIRFRENKQNLVQHAKKLRNQSTLAERELWKHIKNHQIGVKFRRQHVIGNYIVDFVCREKRLIIEVDGGQHNENKQKDLTRDSYLQQRGYRVLRFWNNDVLKNINGVLEEIRKYL